MSVAPLDIQVNIAQMANVAQQQQAAQEQPLVQQEYMGVQTKEQAKIDKEKVQTIEKAEGKKIDEETGGGGGGYHGGAKGQQGKSGEDGKRQREENLDPTRGHFVDVTK